MSSKNYKKTSNKEIVDSKIEVETKCLQEIVDNQKVYNLLKSNMIVDMTKDKKEYEYKTQDFKSLLQFYENNGSISRVYSSVGSNVKGRLYAMHGIGLQSMSKQLRSYLCHDEYLDLDISCCAPSIILQMMKEDCDKHTYDVVYEGYEFPYCGLEDYIDNKKHWREQYKDVIDILNKNYKGVKDLVNVQINSKILRKTNDKSVNFLLKSIFDYVNWKFKNSDSNTVFNAITLVERRIVEQIQSICESKGIRVNTLIFDGLIIQKIGNYDDLVTYINKKIFPYKVEIKPWVVPEIKISIMNKFDYQDPFTFDDFLNLSGNQYISKEHFYMEALPLLIKSCRIVGKILIAKTPKSKTEDPYDTYKNYDSIKFSIGYGSYIDPKTGEKKEGKRLFFSEIIILFRRIISFKKLTSLRYDIEPYEFSTDCGFLTDGHPLPVDWKDRIIKFKEYVFNISSNRNEKIAEGFYYWFSNLIQTDKKSQVIMITTGIQGAGKSMLPTRIIENILGSKGVIHSKLQDITKKFNALLSGKRLVLINEMSNSDSDTKFMDNDDLKNIVDAPYFSLEKKGIDAIQLPNILEFYGCSNHKNCISQCDGLMRRNFITEVSNEKCNDTEYFKDFTDYFENKDNARSIFEFLNTYDLSNYNALKNIPITDIKKIGMFRAIHPVLKTISIACLKDMEIKESHDKKTKEKVLKKIVTITRANLFRIMKEHKLNKTYKSNQEYDVNQMGSYINDYIGIGSKIIPKKTQHAGTITYYISTSDLNYDKKIWDMFENFINDNFLSGCEMFDCTEFKHYCK